MTNYVGFKDQPAWFLGQSLIFQSLSIVFTFIKSLILNLDLIAKYLIFAIEKLTIVLIVKNI
jgi:hypothetical protein